MSSESSVLRGTNGSHLVGGALLAFGAFSAVKMLPRLVRPFPTCNFMFS